MADLKLKYGETSTPIVIDLNSVITAAGFTNTDDITEAICMLKKAPEDSDGAALYTGTLAGGQISFDSTSGTASVRIDDYSSLSTLTAYWFGFGIKFTGDSAFREPDLTDQNRKVVKISFQPDIIRG